MTNPSHLGYNSRDCVHPESVVGLLDDHRRSVFQVSTTTRRGFDDLGILNRLTRSLRGREL
jgi:hypothetical protein